MYNAHRRALSAAAPILILAMASFSCGPRFIDDATVSGAAAPSSWEALIDAAPVCEWSLIDSGEVLVPLSKILDLDAPAARSLADRKVQIRVQSLALERPSGGIVLVDAGLSKAYASRQRGALRGLLVPLLGIPGTQAPGTSVAEALGPNLPDVEAVLFTHLHFDHIAGARDLAPGAEAYAGLGEAAMNVPLLYGDDSLRGFKAIRGLPSASEPAKGDPALPILGRVHDVFGDGSVWSIPTPGHTKGSLSYLFRDDAGPVIFVGDAAMAEGAERGIGPGGYSADKALARESLEKLLAFKKAHPSTRLLFSHAILNSL